MKRRRYFAISVFIAVLFSISAYAQRLDGTLRGKVVDPSAALIPGAEITASNQETGVQQTTKTTSTGEYVFPQLAGGDVHSQGDSERFFRVRPEGRSGPAEPSGNGRRHSEGCRRNYHSGSNHRSRNGTDHYFTTLKRFQCESCHGPAQPRSGRRPSEPRVACAQHHEPGRRSARGRRLHWGCASSPE